MWCCSLLVFVFLCPILFLSPNFPYFNETFVSSFSVNNCTVHVTTLVMRIKILYRYSAYEWSFWFITRQQVLHYRGYQKKSGCKHFITSLHIEKNEPEMFTANKIYGKYRTGNDFFQIYFFFLKYEIGKNQSGDSIKQDVNLVWPKCFFLSYNLTSLLKIFQ